MFFYMATPYTNYPYGAEAAYKHACIEAAFLTAKGVPVYCPIAHSHGLAVHGGLPKFDHDMWMKIDRPFMEAARGLIVCRMTGWQLSAGITHEMETFDEMDKPILFMDPGVVPAGLT